MTATKYVPFLFREILMKNVQILHLPKKKKKKKLRNETQKITELIITLISIILKYITEKYREDIWCCELLWCFL